MPFPRFPRLSGRKKSSVKTSGSSPSDRPSVATSSLSSSDRSKLFEQLNLLYYNSVNMASTIWLSDDAADWTLYIRNVNDCLTLAKSIIADKQQTLINRKIAEKIAGIVNHIKSVNDKSADVIWVAGNVTKFDDYDDDYEIAAPSAGYALGAACPRTSTPPLVTAAERKAAKEAEDAHEYLRKAVDRIRQRGPRRKAMYDSDSD